jgi:hypothetical protein
MIPSRYAILENAYRTLLPDFPADMYPVLMQAGLDHDIQLAAYNISVPDFQVSTIDREYEDTVVLTVCHSALAGHSPS